jgi:hypothetical protein
MALSRVGLWSICRLSLYLKDLLVMHPSSSQHVESLQEPTVLLVADFLLPCVADSAQVEAHAPHPCPLSSAGEKGRRYESESYVCL